MNTKLITFLLLLFANYYIIYCLGWIKAQRDNLYKLRSLLDDAAKTEMTADDFIDKVISIHIAPEEPYLIFGVNYIAAKLYKIYKNQKTN